MTNMPPSAPLARWSAPRDTDTEQYLHAAPFTKLCPFPPAQNDNCPQAFQAHFPCEPNRNDYRFCQDGWHNYCIDQDTLRVSFACDHIEPKAGVNEYWDGTADAGIWGGECTCPGESLTTNTFKSCHMERPAFACRLVVFR